ncbi:MAG: hypothetical protein QF734_07015 [Arenicellales bacterium]|nr:hypothetical protein [Arenicellales bacterium]
MFDNLSLDMFGHLMPNNPPPPNLRDFQRQKLYRFEEARLQKHPFNLDLTLPECTTLARKYNHRIKVKDGRGRRHAGASFGENLITLPRWARQTVIVLHEIAHTLVDDRKYPHHGAEFVGVLFALLSQESISTIPELCEAANRSKLRYDHNWIYHHPHKTRRSARL